MPAQDAAVATFDCLEVVPAFGHSRVAAKDVLLKVSTVFPKGQLLAPVPSSNPVRYGPYVRGAGDTTANAELILRRACATDSSGNIFLAATASSEWGQSQTMTSAWAAGDFLVADLNATGANGLDAAGVAAMGGHLKLNGTVLSF